MKIQKSKLFQQLISKNYIYRAIYSLKSYVFDEFLLSEEDYNLMQKLRDPFNHEAINITINDVKKMIEEVLANNKFFEAEVYFKPKKIEGESIEFRPIHSASLITLIASVVLLNSLIFEYNEKKRIMELSELARILPTNFYGNIPSEKPENLFEPYYIKFKEYTDVITQKYDKYSKTKEFEYEVTLDLKNFYPSINPMIIYDFIIDMYKTEDERVEFECLKCIVAKLLVFKITNIDNEKYRKWYYICDNNISINANWSMGIPQGLPHAYFFGNICMIKIVDLLKKYIIGDNGKAFFYVDDSVIYTNNIKDDNDLHIKVGQVNSELKKMGSIDENRKREYLDIFRDTGVESYIEDICKLKYEIKLHDVDNEKSTIIKIGDTKFGQANLNAYSKMASMVSFDLKKIFSDTEGENFINKLNILVEAVDNEIERMLKNFGDKIEPSGYYKVLIRLKKFFKYRQRIARYSHENSIIEDDKAKLIDNFTIRQGNSVYDKIGHFFKAYDEDILFIELKFFFMNCMNFWDEFHSTIDKFNEFVYGNDYKWNKNNKERTVSFYHKICSFQSKQKLLQIENDISKYDSIRKIIRRNLYNIAISNSEDRQRQICESIKIFYSLISEDKEENNDTQLSKALKEAKLISLNDDIYKYVRYQTSELYRIFMNAYFSEMLSVEVNDMMYLSKSSNKPLFYNEARLLFFLRNNKFNISDFYGLFSSFVKGEIFDYSLLEIIDYLVKYINCPKLIDNVVLVHKFTSEIWKNGSKYLHFYTLHNQDHAMELIKSIIKFTKGISYFNLSKLDYYILFISCYLHDISMVIHPNLVDIFVKDNKASNLIYSQFKRQVSGMLDSCRIEGEDIEKFNYIGKETIKNLLVEYFIKLDQYFENYVRDSHAAISGNFIKKNKDLEFIDEPIRNIITSVSKAHGYEVEEVYQVKASTENSIINEKYIKILLRIGDLLDMASNRISNAILNNNQEAMSIATRFHWLSHKAISNVDIKVNYQKASNSGNDSFIGPYSIIENIEFIVKLNIKHIVNFENKKKCNVNVKISDSDYVVNFQGSCKEENCRFMCKWMSIKNEYLYKEIKALQKYLNRSDGNIFKTNITVKYSFSDDARKLNSDELKYINDYIEKI